MPNSVRTFGVDRGTKGNFPFNHYIIDGNKRQRCQLRQPRKRSTRAWIHHVEDACHGCLWNEEPNKRCKSFTSEGWWSLNHHCPAKRDGYLVVISFFFHKYGHATLFLGHWTSSHYLCHSTLLTKVHKRYSWTFWHSRIKTVSHSLICNINSQVTSWNIS